MASPGRYSSVRESQPDGDPPPAGVPTSKVLGLVGYLLPVVFAAGSFVAGFKYLSSETDRLSSRVEQLVTANIDRDRRIQALESNVQSLSKDLEAAERQRQALESRASKLERNVVVICTTSRNVSCER